MSRKLTITAEVESGDGFPYAFALGLGNSVHRESHEWTVHEWLRDDVTIEDVDAALNQLRERLGRKPTVPA